MNYRELLNIGLSEKESKVYLASLKLGKSSVQKIATSAKVNRATTYVIIEHLMEKGLMSSTTEGKKQYFIAESPEKLSLLFREQQMEIQKKQDYLDKILPDLKSLKQKENDGPVVRYFEGKDGMRAMSDEFFLHDHKETANTFFSFDLLKNIFSEEERKWMQRRRQDKDIKIRSIINDKDRKIKSDAKIQTVSSKDYPITADLAFFGDKVRIVTQKGDPFGIIIQNKEIANTFKTLFKLAWEAKQEKKGAK